MNAAEVRLRSEHAERLEDLCVQVESRRHCSGPDLTFRSTSLFSGDLKREGCEPALSRIF